MHSGPIFWIVNSKIHPLQVIVLITRGIHIWKGNNPSLISILSTTAFPESVLLDRRKESTKILDPLAWVKKYLIIPSNIVVPPLNRGRKENSVSSNPIQMMNQLSPDITKKTPIRHLGIITNHLGCIFMNMSC